MTRKQRIGLIVVISAVIANYAPLLDRHAEQDNCTFGPVSNADYRAYLGRAKSLLPFPMLDDKALALAVQLPFLRASESMGNHDSNVVDAGRVG